MVKRKGVLLGFLIYSQPSVACPCTLGLGFLDLAHIGCMGTVEIVSGTSAAMMGHDIQAQQAAQLRKTELPSTSRALHAKVSRLPHDVTIASVQISWIAWSTHEVLLFVMLILIECRKIMQCRLVALRVQPPHHHGVLLSARTAYNQWCTLPTPHDCILPPTMPLHCLLQRAVCFIIDAGGVEYQLRKPDGQ